MGKRILYGIAGLMIGFFAASAFFMPELKAQMGDSAASSFNEAVLNPVVPSSYGDLVAISGIDMYFQASDGTVRIVKPRTNTELDSRVVVVKRAE